MFLHALPALEHQGDTDPSGPSWWTRETALPPADIAGRRRDPGTFRSVIRQHKWDEPADWAL